MKEYEECEIFEEEDLNLKYKNLVKLFSIQSKSYSEAPMINYIINYCKKNKYHYEKDNIGNILITKGKLKEDEYYPCIVAHMDTVHEFIKDFEIFIDDVDGIDVVYAYGIKQKFDRFKTILDYKELEPTYTQVGCGGDDRCGIYLALEVLKSFRKVKILLTVQEEVGGNGSNEVSPNWIEDVGYFIQGDRRGNSDIVFNIMTDIASEEFKKIVEPLAFKYGFTSANGMFTDVDVLSRRFSLSAINLSVGYYNPHSNEEYVVIEDLKNSIDLVKIIVKTLKNNKYPHKRKQTRRFGNYYYGDVVPYDDYYDDFDTYSKEYYNEFCNCTSLLTDLDCKICNPEIPNRKVEFCPSCGSVLKNR